MYSIFNRGLFVVMTALIVCISNAKAIPIGSVVPVPGGPKRI